LRNALGIVIATKKSAKALDMWASRPSVLGAIPFSNSVTWIEKSKGTFDYILKIASLVKRHPIVIPFKSHTRLNYWLSKPGAKLLNGCILGDTWAAVYIKIPDHSAKEGSTLGIDIGVNKLLVDSNGTIYGNDIKAICNRVGRCTPGSKGRLRANRARKDYINKTIKELPWDSLGTIGVEDLTNMKKGKRKGRGKTFRKAIAPWTYRQAITRITCLAQENRVRLVAVDPRDTSRTCPRCGWVAKENRRGENFLCVRCNYSADADFVGAQNILARTLGNSQHSMVAELLSW
jgi:IS605 OrfB family transposase